MLEYLLRELYTVRDVLTLHIKVKVNVHINHGVVTRLTLLWLILLAWTRGCSDRRTAWV
jgi:hypothetical protein